MEIDADGGLPAPAPRAPSPSREPDTVSIRFVQGPSFAYLRGTLASFPDSIFAPHFSPSHPLNAGRTPPSSFLLDRDPELFRKYVDPLLRGYSVPGREPLPPPGAPERAMLRDDALFYGLDALAESLEEPSDETPPIERVLSVRGQRDDDGMDMRGHPLRGEGGPCEVYLSDTPRLLAALDAGLVRAVHPAGAAHPDPAAEYVRINLPEDRLSPYDFDPACLFAVRLAGMAGFSVDVDARPRNSPAFRHARHHIRIAVKTWEDEGLERLLRRIHGPFSRWEAAVTDVAVGRRGFAGALLSLLQTRLDTPPDAQSLAFVSSLLPRGLAGSAGTFGSLAEAVESRGETAAAASIVLENPIFVFQGVFSLENDVLRFICTVFGDLDSMRTFYAPIYR